VDYWNVVKPTVCLQVWLAAFCWLATPALPATEPLTITGRALGTTYSVKINSRQTNLAPKEIQKLIESRLAEIDRQMSTYRKDSEISRFNSAQSTNWFPISNDFAFVVAEAQHISKLTRGAFDVTVDPLVRLWGFGPERRTSFIPGPASIVEARRKVGYLQLQFRTEPPAIRKDLPELSMDLSAIAKGYAVDAVGSKLESLGFTNYLAEIGGELKALGHGSSGAGWRVAIESPDESRPGIQRVLQLHNQSLATSGDYRNYFIANGRRFAHIIDPRTGEPPPSPPASVSVISDTTARADALATGLEVLGVDEGYRLAIEHKLAVLFVLRTSIGFLEKASPAFQKLLPAK
jgi:thiamine biosynthesis lipoprotein